MPTAAPHACAQPGCPALVPQGKARCPTHQRQAYVKDRHDRGSANERGYGARWRKARYAFLRVHPLCAEHERQGEVEAATVVDHVVPHRGDAVLFWDQANWQGLCKPCHDRKTATEDGGFGRAQA